MKSSPILYVHYDNSHGHDGPLQSQLMKSSPILYVHYVNSHGHDGPTKPTDEVFIYIICTLR